MKIAQLILFSVGLFAVQSCHKSSNTPVVITDANFSISGYELPVPVTITFINVSQNATSYTWDFGDGSSSTEVNPTHTYNLASTYSLKLTATGPTGQDVICKTVTVEQLSANHSGFSYFTDKCVGVPVNIAFKSLNPASTNYSWDFGNGVTNISNSPNVQFIQAGDYPIRFSSRVNGVQDTVIRIIRIQ